MPSFVIQDLDVPLVELERTLNLPTHGNLPAVRYGSVGLYLHLMYTVWIHIERREDKMGTVEKDEAAILKVLQKNPKGIRSTDLWFAVRGSVRSLTTFQKRLKHLEQMDRVQIKTDITDPRARVITPTETSAGAAAVLNGIEMLEMLYLGKRPKTKIQVVTLPSGKTEERKHSPEEQRVQAGANLFFIAYKAFVETWPRSADSYIWLGKKEYIHPLSGKKHEAPYLHEIPRTMLDKAFDDVRRLNQIETAILNSPELKGLMEAEGFVVDADGVRKTTPGEK